MAAVSHSRKEFANDEGFLPKSNSAGSRVACSCWRAKSETSSPPALLIRLSRTTSMSGSGPSSASSSDGAADGTSGADGFGFGGAGRDARGDNGNGGAVPDFDSTKIRSSSPGGKVNSIEVSPRSGSSDSPALNADDAGAIGAGAVGVGVASAGAGRADAAGVGATGV